eukprot:10064355-Karenia_brevis.AAC.1
MVMTMTIQMVIMIVMIMMMTMTTMMFMVVWQAGGQEYSLYWRRNLEPWVLHKEGVQGSAEEVQLTERDCHT